MLLDLPSIEQNSTVPDDAVIQRWSCFKRCRKTCFYTIFTKCTSVSANFPVKRGEKKTPRYLFMSVIRESVSDLVGLGGSSLYLQKLLDILNALLCCHADDVIQRFHVDQHLDGLSDQVPDSRYKL